GVQAIKELTNIPRLRSQSSASRFNDRRIEPQALRDIDAGGGSRHTDFQLIGGLQCGFVESHGGVYHSGCVRAVNLQRCVVSRDYGDAVNATEMFCNGNG